MRSSRRNRLGLVVAILCLVGGGVAAALALTGGRNSGSKSSHEVTSTIIAEWRFAEGKGTLTSNASRDGHDGKPGVSVLGPGRPRPVWPQRRVRYR